MLSFCQSALRAPSADPHCFHIFRKKGGKHHWARRGSEWPKARSALPCTQRVAETSVTRMEKKKPLRVLIFQWCWWAGVWGGLGPHCHWWVCVYITHCPCFFSGVNRVLGVLCLSRWQSMTAVGLRFCCQTSPRLFSKIKTAALFTNAEIAVSLILSFKLLFYVLQEQISGETIKLPLHNFKLSTYNNLLL